LCTTGAGGVVAGCGPARWLYDFSPCELPRLNKLHTMMMLLLLLLLEVFD
jgi:hypothetical protein